jgi:RNA polymerase sigma-70 factor (ECF subfamily)
MTTGWASSEVDDPTALVERIRAGDPAAETELVERYRHGLLYLLRRVTGDPASSEDVFQETFQVLLRRIRAGELREPDKLDGFVRQTAKNLAMKERHRSGQRTGAAEWEPDRGPADPEEGQLVRLLREEQARLVRQVLGELRSARDRQVLFRYYLAGHDKEEICRDLGLSSLNFNLVLFRARERFRKLVEEAEDRRLAALAPRRAAPGDSGVVR